jgi:hypothetical protein
LYCLFPPHIRLLLHLQELLQYYEKVILLSLLNSLLDQCNFNLQLALMIQLLVKIIFEELFIKMKSIHQHPCFKIEFKFLKLNIDMIQKLIWRQIVYCRLLESKSGKIRLQNLNIQSYSYLIILLLLYQEF